MSGGVYIYYFKGVDITNSYVGSAFNFHKRNKEHLNLLIKNSHYNTKLQTTYNKYGAENMVYEILEEVVFPINYESNIKKEYLQCREQMYYNRFKSSLNQMEPGSNYVSSKTKEELSLIFNKVKRPVYHIDSNFNIIKEYSSLTEAAQDLNLSPLNISKVARLKWSHTKGHIFRFKENLDKKFDRVDKSIRFKGLSKLKARKPIKCYDLLGNFIADYDCGISAAKALNINSGSICASCYKLRKYVNGYIFRFADDLESPISVSKKRIRSEVDFYEDGFFVKTYPSMNAASNELLIPRSSVDYYLKSGKTYKQKYQFKYKQIKNQPI